ncbi:transcriptional regulator [Streptomyces sp. CB02923]|uniref:helix-turn-helix domain-containing protein n=1 Tax=Streptomyces sp. CB02923 TaxID=1718985 RepID=UPI00093F1994|nr:helix-turn-helix transcriptional regulator [Streptomyces sp. CB02923]OKH97810.1 transcriptional regulator [Streptomyces sp. CB02923]
MTNENAQPPMAWRYCGNQIKLWRTRAEISREALADEAGYAAEYVKSMEQGRRKPTVHLLQVADQMCGARGLLKAAEDYLQPDKFPSYSADYLRYEADAIAVSSYQAQLVPGLLQTEAYARHLIESRWPPLDREAIEQRIAFRMERQPLLDKETRTFSFVINEVALRHEVGTRREHEEQLRRLLEACERRNVTLQVLPCKGGASPALFGPFNLLEMPDHDRIAYEEGHLGGVLCADPERVSHIIQRYGQLVQRAMHSEDSAQFIKRLAEE